MQIWSICHVCLGILILVFAGEVFLWQLYGSFPTRASRPHRSFLPSKVDDFPDRPRWAENCLRIGCRSRFRGSLAAAFSSFLLPFPPFSRKEGSRQKRHVRDTLRKKNKPSNGFSVVHFARKRACLYFIIYRFFMRSCIILFDYLNHLINNIVLYLRAHICAAHVCYLLQWTC